MIVIDTNVISALMRAEPDSTIVQWFDAQAPESIWTTTITIFELRLGIERLPVSRRRRQLADELARMLVDDIEDRVLPFDEPAAEEAAVLSARRQRLGKPVDLRDTMIAGIVLSRRAQLVTHNTRHFRDLDVRVIDPLAK